MCRCVPVLNTPSPPSSPISPTPHLASVASSSSIQISGLWRRCRPGSRCTAPASCRGSSAAGEQSVGGRVALLLVASAGSNRWRLPLPWFSRNSRYKISPVSVRVSSLFSSVHRRGRSADKTRHKPPVSALPAITAPYFSHNAVKSRKKIHNTSRYCIFSVAVILRAIDLNRTAVYLSVTFHQSVSQRTAAVTERLLQPIFPHPVCRVVFPWSTGETGNKQKKISERDNGASESS